MSGSFFMIVASCDAATVTFNEGGTSGDVLWVYVVTVLVDELADVSVVETDELDMMLCSGAVVVVVISSFARFSFLQS